jgi:arylsulfatase A-like enzyme
LAHMQRTARIPPDLEMADRLTGPQPWDASDNGWIWDDLDAEAQADQAALMAVYAAMVHRIDRNVGRVRETLERLGLARNTLLLFLSDNGGSPYPNHDDPEHDPGPPGTWRTLNTAWANVNSAPFRLFKRYAHEGGITTPMIAWWPGGLVQPGRTTDAPFHVIDFMPTLVEITGAEYPATRYGDPVLPMAGRSFAPLLRDEKSQSGRQLFWEYQENYAVRDGRWKLVQSNLDRRWELYDLAADRGETNDLAATHPDIAERMKVRWQAWMAAVSAHRAFTDRGGAGQ